MFTYLPELRKVRRITSRTISGTFLGTDFSYEDLEELQSVSDRASVTRLADAQVEGRPVAVLSGTPAVDSGSSYRRVVSYVDHESCVALRTLLYQSGDQPQKELVVDWRDVERRGQRWVPRKATLRNLEDGSETRILIEKLELDVDIPDRLFSESELAKGR
jgi:outer membrane lipoprotein-sorting protein